jgi:hypothetical protein
MRRTYRAYDEFLYQQELKRPRMMLLIVALFGGVVMAAAMVIGTSHLSAALPWFLVGCVWGPVSWAFGKPVRAKRRIDGAH